MVLMMLEARYKDLPFNAMELHHSLIHIKRRLIHNMLYKTCFVFQSPDILQTFLEICSLKRLYVEVRDILILFQVSPDLNLTLISSLQSLQLKRVVSEV